MATSRTGTSEWKTLRARAIRLARIRGITHCPICGVAFDYEHSKQPNSPEPDHIIPWARGGRNALENLRIICRRCNQSKGHREAPKTATVLAAKPLRTSRRW
jgi:5-methylcytosine-specific restriction protein A